MGPFQLRIYSGSVNNSSLVKVSALEVIMLRKAEVIVKTGNREGRVTECLLFIGLH